MRRLFILLNGFLVIYCFSVVYAESVKRGTREYALALRDGANTRCTLRVVDAEGNVVTGASVQASFATVGSKWIKGLSDSNGLFSVEGKSRGEMIYDVKKAGYYPTAGKYGFGGVEDIVLEDGKWLPWDPTNTLILKQIKNPIAMYASFAIIQIPVKNKTMGFDLEINDWVDPYGKGIYSDLVVSYEEEITDPWTGFKRLVLMFGTNEYDGVRIVSKDEFSTFHSQYEAPLRGYGKSVSWAFERTKEKTITNTGPAKDEYFIFRVRTKADEKGNITQANHGKIYGPVEYGLMNGKALLKITYYLNPTPNDRNLEFDPKKNLFKNLKSTEQVNMP